MPIACLLLVRAYSFTATVCATIDKATLTRCRYYYETKVIKLLSWRTDSRLPSHDGLANRYYTYRCISLYAKVK